MAGIGLDVIVHSCSCACLISERLSCSLRLVTGPCKESFGSDVTGVNGQSFRPKGEVNLLVERGVASIESAVLGPKLPVTFILGPDYLLRQLPSDLH